MTSTERGFLADIIANPEDDVPRLIYADWLEDHGQDERAEFIRVQIDEMTKHTCKCAPALFVSPGCPTCKLVKPMRSRNRSLLTKLADAFRPQVPWSWSVSLFTPTRDTPCSIIRRGFLAEIHAPLTVLMEHLPRLVRRHPIERVRATDREPRIIFSRANDFLWLPGISQTHLHEIPFEVAQRLGRKATFVSGLMVYSYPTVEAAHDDLSVALLKLSKHYSLERNRHDQTRMG